MVYLVDDKKARQKGAGWDGERLASFKDVVCPIYSLEEIENRKNEIFSGQNVVLYHESFLDKSNRKSEAGQRLIKLQEFTKNHPGFSLVLFSGSKHTRFLQDNGREASLPVEVLYSNLEEFLLSYRKEPSSVDLRKILFGANPKLEELLVEARNNSRVSVRAQEITPRSRLFFVEPETSINIPFANIESEAVFKTSDDYLDKFVKKHFTTKEYQAIYLPLCFGEILSDFNGLRLALHLRCTPSPNQTTPIYLYSYANLYDVLDHKYFDIVKTKAVDIINYDHESFRRANEASLKPLKKSELKAEFERINIPQPKDFNDTHSVLNEIAIAKWHHALGGEGSFVKDVLERAKTDVYFKYRRIVNILGESTDRLAGIALEPITEQPRIGLIDDEYEKGWAAIFSEFFINKLDVDDFEYYEGDFLRPKLELFDSLKKWVQQQQLDILLLDFRLHPEDKGSPVRDNYLSLMLLEWIKTDYNPGVQVIIVSATNRALNLQALLNHGANDFFYKDFDLPAQKALSEFREKIVKHYERAVELKYIHASSRDISNRAVWLNKEFSRKVETCFGSTLALWEQSYSFTWGSRYRAFAFLQLYFLIEAFSKNSEVITEKKDNLKVKGKYSDVDVYKKNNKGYSRSAIEYNQGMYKVVPCIFDRKPDLNYRICAILLHTYGWEESRLGEWKEIMILRNGLAHGREKTVDMKRLKNIIVFLQEVFDKKSWSVPVKEFEI